MITNTDVTIFAFGDVSAVETKDTSGVAFLVHEDSDFFSLFEIFCYSIDR